MAFLSVQRTMRSRPSLHSATKARPARHRRTAKLRVVEDGAPAAYTAPPAAPVAKILPLIPHAYANRARAAGGPEDHALYTCDCGFMFEADVSAAVGCPHCGTEQSW